MRWPRPRLAPVTTAILPSRSFTCKLLGNRNGSGYARAILSVSVHPLRKLREPLAENIVFNSPILVRPITGREVIEAIFAQSSATRGSGTYTAELKLDER